MTSKKALEILEAYCTDYDSLEYPVLDCKDELNAIEKDLEVLEILKKYLYVGGDSITEKIKLKWDSIDEMTSKEDFNKVKRFLEE